MIELSTLGGVAIRQDGVDWTDLAQHKQKLGLLTYLAAEGPLARDRLLTVFWPERSEERARHSLSQGLYALKKEMGVDCVRVEGDRISLHPEVVSVDLKQLEKAAEEERWEDVVELYRGAFLDEFYLPDAPDFNDWRDRTQAWVARLARRAFKEVIGSRAASGDDAGALAVASRWVRLEPTEDEANHALVALLARTGDRSVALTHFEDYKARISREMELEPMDATLALVQQIRSGETPELVLLSEAETAPEPTAAAHVTPVAVITPEEAHLEAPGNDVESLLKNALAPAIEVVRKLGESSTAVVYLAREPSLKRFLAIKVFSPALADNKRARMRFEREAEAVASLVHPNIVSLHWVGTLTNDLPYFVMEYVEGGRTVNDKMKAGEGFTVDQATKILRSVSAALVAAHRRGIVHRDVQPANLLCDEMADRCLLADFGFARILASAEFKAVRITESGELIGNPAFMSPEQLKGEDVTERSDIYALGLLGYHLLAGRGPFDAESRRELFAAQINAQPRKLSDFCPDVPAALEKLLENCLAKDPHHRPTAIDVLHRLETIAKPEPEPPLPDEDESWLTMLVRRRIPHVLGLYVPIGFIVVELASQLVPRVPQEVYDITLATYLIGLPTVVMATWFHGEKGRQKRQAIEYWIYGAFALIWLAVVGTILSP